MPTVTHSIIYYMQDSDIRRLTQIQVERAALFQKLQQLDQEEGAILGTSEQLKQFWVGEAIKDQVNSLKFLAEAVNCKKQELSKLEDECFRLNRIVWETYGKELQQKDHTSAWENLNRSGYFRILDLARRNVE